MGRERSPRRERERESIQVGSIAESRDVETAAFYQGNHLFALCVATFAVVQMGNLDSYETVQSSRGGGINNYIDSFIINNNNNINRLL